MNTNLPYFVETLDSISEELQQYYVEDDGGFLLNVEGVVPKAKLNEFRTTNRKLNAELEKFKYVDVDEYKQLKDSQTKDSVKGVVQEYDVENIVESRVKEMRDSHSSILNEYEELKGGNTQLSTLLIDNEVTSVATKHSIKPTAIEDILLRANRIFKVSDGKVEAHESSGDIVYNKNGDPLTIEEWIASLETDAPHLFQESTGAGTIGNKPSIGKTPSGMPLTPRDLIAEGLRKR